MPSTDITRRGLLAACGAATVPGCSALASEPVDVVAAVEWKSVSITDGDEVREYVDNVPADGSVENDAPASLELRNRQYEEDGPVSFPADGPLRVDDGAAAALDDAYEAVEYGLVFTFYERERVVGVPVGNSHGYRVDREGFNRVDPGDRVVVNVAERDGPPRVTDVVEVTSADG